MSNMNKIIFSNISFVLLIIITFSVLSISLIFNNVYGIMQNNLEEQINNKSSFSSPPFSFSYNFSKSIIQDKINLVQLLSNYIESRIQNAQSVLLISSQDESVSDNSSANLISEEFMGIPENADILKREMAKRILELEKDFGSVYFATPKADIYLGEPFSQQKQLQRLNYADREWYKGIINFINNNTEHNLTTTTTNIYTSGIFISASIHTPAISIATPVYKKFDANYSSNNNNNNHEELIGYWVGILNFQDIIKSVTNLNLTDNERIVIFDQNGTIVTDSKNDYYENSTELKYFEYLDKVSNVLDGEKGVKAENDNNNDDNLPTLLIYYPINTGSHYWGVVYMIN